MSHNKDETRRRILKGAAYSAPLIWTLPVGSAVAASSNTCYANPESIVDTDDPNYPYMYNGDPITASCWSSINPGSIDAGDIR